MSHIVFAPHLRNTLNNSDGASRPFFARPSVWIVMLTLNLALAAAITMSWKPDSVWALLFPQAKAYAIAKSRMPAAPASPASETLPIEPALDPQAQKAAEYIASTYHIAKEASELIVRECFKSGKENSVDPLLVLAIIGVESGFNPISESEAGALGLTQTMPESHPEKIATIQKDQGHILNITDNIRLGTKIIGEYMRKFGNNPVLALQQYNGSLKDKTRVYSTKVLELRAKFVHASS